MPFTKIPNEMIFDPNLSATEKVVFAAVRSYGDGKDGKNCYPSHDTIAQRLGCRRETVQKALKALRQACYLDWDQRIGTSCRYGFPRVAASTTSQPCDRNITGDAIKESHNQDSINKIHHPPGVRLFHGKDLCSVQGERIRIRTHDGTWVDYGGGDDGSFKYGELKGKEALSAAISRFKDYQKKV